ncbi:hypothetical protein B5M47_03760 [candidate division CPR3 bacterium 4484_211]|uniref:Uncharacterized protein n=1 Tax=candidate division CPR3 bacterium 4484_211 TaxID=1968527 RepID=A0A1W9NWI1_UNCC3|nr:MAG: hypothetical protein B5M47_03760 [candidate division CPR3 bacterium 4484_211]
MKASGYSTLYAGWLLPQEIRSLSVDKNGNHWANPNGKMYLTKLYRNYRISEIDDDVVFTNAGNNKAVGRGRQWAIEQWKLWLIILLPLITELAILGIIAFTEVNHWKKKRSS